MCGIAGFNWGDEELVARMLGRITHRGPDSGGSYVAPEVSLGSRRLAIIDLSARGNQPLPNEDRSVWIVFNGEIYNHRDLRRRLEGRGHRFAGASDTEVVVHAYEEWGTDCLRRLNGEFALAIWDSRRRRLFLARDRLGIKPLYYAWRGGRLIFASEIKALLEWDALDRTLEPDALLYYLGYEFTPAPLTMFAGVAKLEPGHRLVLEDGRLADEAWWDVPLYRGNATRREAEDQLISTLEESVRLRLRADVPVGLFLSGGLDSSLILSLSAALGTALPQTFALGYAESSYSELEEARRIAEHFGTEHHELLIEGISPDDVRETAWSLDEPMTDLSAIPFYLISREARRRVKVALSGEGGDELLCGYDRFRASRLDGRLRLLPATLGRGLLDYMADRLPDGEEKKSLRAKLKRFAQGARLAREGRHVRWQYFFPPEHEKLVREPQRWGLDRHDRFAPVRRHWEASEHHRNLNRESYVDLKLLLPDSLLVKADKMSMAHGLEVRVPFLDHNVVELTVPFPPSWKLDGSRTKAILRSAAARHHLLPERVLTRGKQGYSFPSKNWLRGPLRPFLEETLAGSRILAELCDRAVLDRLVQEHLEMRHNHNHLLWSLVNLAVWHDLYVENPPPRIVAAGEDSVVRAVGGPPVGGGADVELGRPHVGGGERW
ncbi:MAG: asparagine synthase (glutamine-hydrolyzing) [Gemmatimonadota bacterium]